MLTYGSLMCLGGVTAEEWGFCVLMSSDFYLESLTCFLSGSKNTAHRLRDALWLGEGL